MLLAVRMTHRVRSVRVANMPSLKISWSFLTSCPCMTAWEHSDAGRLREVKQSVIVNATSPVIPPRVHESSRNAAFVCPSSNFFLVIIELSVNTKLGSYVRCGRYIDRSLRSRH